MTTVKPRDITAGQRIRLADGPGEPHTVYTVDEAAPAHPGKVEVHVTWRGWRHNELWLPDDTDCKLVESPDVEWRDARGSDTQLVRRRSIPPRVPVSDAFIYAPCRPDPSDVRTGACDPDEGHDTYLAVIRLGEIRREFDTQDQARRFVERVIDADLWHEAPSAVVLGEEAQDG